MPDPVTPAATPLQGVYPAPLPEPAVSQDKSAADKPADQPNGQVQAGTEWIDFKDLPPSVEARFKRLYAHVKEGERALASLRDHNGQLQAAIEADRVSQTTVQRANQEQSLRGQLTEAIQRGDTARQVDLTGQLAAVKASPIQHRPVAGQLPDVPDYDLTTLRSWRDEVDDKGSFVRPWAQTTHPKNREVVQMVQTLMQMPGFSGDIDSLLAEADRRMAVPTGSPRPSGQASTVLSGSGDAPRRPRPGEVTAGSLSVDQKRVADKMGIKHEVYAKQLQAINQAKAS